MASFNELAHDYATRLRRGASAHEIAREIDSLVYTGSGNYLSPADKRTILEKVRDRLAPSYPVDDKGRRIILDSDNSAYLRLVEQLYALLSLK